MGSARNLISILSSNVTVADCWLWGGKTDGDGYGVFGAGPDRIHRVVWQELVGPVPEGLVLDHLCRVRTCCNPDHMRCVTPGENVLCGYGISAMNARKTHCANGHEFNEENTSPRKGRGGRECKPCRRDQARRRRAAA